MTKPYIDHSEPPKRRGRDSLGDLYDSHSEHLLEQVDRLDAAGVPVGARTRLAAGYAEGYRKAASAKEDS